MQQTTPRTYAHGIEHTRPIHASGRHIGDAANEPADDGLTGRPILRGDGRFSEAWARADARYWRAYAAECGECACCGFRLPRHEDGCPDAPEQINDEEDDQQ